MLQTILLRQLKLLLNTSLANMRKSHLKLKITELLFGRNRIAGINEYR